jgi:hypothetical protein
MSNYIAVSHTKIAVNDTTSLLSHAPPRGAANEAGRCEGTRRALVPNQFFETEVLKETAAQAKWRALRAYERRAIANAFFRIVISPELRSRIRRLPDQVRPNGRKLLRFILDLGFGEFAFAIPRNRSGIILILIDFYVDAELLQADLTCPNLAALTTATRQRLRLNAPSPSRSPRSSSWHRRGASWYCRDRTAGCRCRHSPTPASAC